MVIRVRAQGHLRHFRPDRQERFSVELPDGATVRELITRSGIPWEEVGVVAVNGGVVEEDHALQDGDEVFLLVPMEGG